VTTFPDADTMRAAQASAVRAPSVHNSQPWRWHVGADRLDLFAEPDLHLRQADPDGRDLLLSCGATLHHAVVALAALGWLAHVQRFPDPSNANHLATLTLSPRPPTDVELALAAAIPHRRTDRRRYSGREVSAADIAVMEARAAKEGVSLRRVEPLAGLRAAVDRAMREHLHDDAYLRELTTWSGRYGSVAGVPAANVPPADESAPTLGRVFAGGSVSHRQGPGDGVDNAVVLALGTRDDDAPARLRAGEATSAVLLTATSIGLASCPVTEPLEVAATRATLREEIFESQAHPQMLLRIGWAPEDAATLPATPRRPLPD
jgi:nitroreductase